MKAELEIDKVTIFLTYNRNKSYIKNVEFLETYQKNTKNSKKTIKKMKK